eukprot:CAMPEP_0113498220 /NCGR_PEP_ID=MMETSP0014_2-20120614/31043_1 /TAXON_ID=2857 /ORGANISM="Nitzschia sp." /LENGTH=340 /DNA_ID=CAMNT_0000392203 /DNA_START=116 /DNA_END=1138 /DNA_ORIENTATION=- /assembly_acc=CAM_ASM_000159
MAEEEAHRQLTRDDDIGYKKEQSTTMTNKTISPANDDNPLPAVIWEQDGNKITADSDDDDDAQRRRTKLNTDIVKSVVFDRDLRDHILSFMDLRMLLYFPSLYKGLEQYVTHDLVVEKIAETVERHSKTSSALKLFEFLISKMERRIIFTPSSPMRLLRLMVATKCEFCLKQTWTRYESTFGLSDCTACRDSAVTTIIQKNRCTSHIRHDSAVCFETIHRDRKVIKKEPLIPLPSTSSSSRVSAPQKTIRVKTRYFRYVHFKDPFFDKFTGEPIGPIITLAVPYEHLQQTYDDADRLLLHANKTVYQRRTTVLLPRWKKIIEDHKKRMEDHRLNKKKGVQ